MKTVANVIGVARSNLAERAKHAERKLVGRRPQPDEDLVGEIKGVITDLPTYGYRRGQAILPRRAGAEGRQPPNHKRVYAVMKRHGLLLERHAGGTERRHDGRIAVAEPNLCCDREAMSFVATTAGIGGDEVRDLMVAAVEHRYGG